MNKLNQLYVFSKIDNSTTGWFAECSEFNSDAKIGYEIVEYRIGIMDYNDACESARQKCLGTPYWKTNGIQTFPPEKFS